MEFCTVIHSCQGIIDTVYLFKGETAGEVAEKAEKCFIGLCKENVEDFSEYSKEDIDAMIEDGYAGDCMKSEIVIHWPVVEK